MSKSKPFVLSIIVLIVCCYACSSLRRPKEEGAFMDNISTRYNILYNSQQLIQQLENNTNQYVPDAYETPLSVFKIPNTSSIEANQLLADSLIGKSNRIIDEKKDSKYVGNAFLFKALAYYYTGEYFTASEFARYLAENYPKYRLKGLGYQALSLMRLESYASAKKVLDSAFNGLTPDSPAYALLQGVKAAYALKTQQSDTARMALAHALSHGKKHRDKHRWHYLLGQLNRQTGNDAYAYANFKEVVKSNVSYEMAFYAQLNCIEIEHRNKTDILAQVDQLERLLKDNKNKNFKALIYERIGDVYAASKETDKAHDQYVLGLQHAAAQAAWQTNLYAKLGDLHYDQQQYHQAIAYLDSALMVAPEPPPPASSINYLRVKRKTATLHQIIARNDSLQALATLTPEARTTWADSLSLIRYMDLLPDSADGMVALIDSTQQALLSLADLYQNALRNIPAATTHYLNFVARFPNHQAAALAYYQLYVMSKDQPAQTETYRDKLLSGFPESRYARFILKPASVGDHYALLTDFNNQYASLYHLYNAHQYDSVKTTIDSIVLTQKFASLPSMPQMEYLSVLALGKTGSPAAFEQALLALVQKYPADSLVTPVAQQQIAFIQANQETFMQRPIALLSASAPHTQPKEIILTPWPELTLNKQYAVYAIERKNFNDLAVQSARIGQNTGKKELANPKSIETGQIGEIRHENSYRNLDILPDSALYYFVINVMHPTVNLSPSRFGIGQFNRGHYPHVSISHQLKTAGDENQLIYIGVFHTFDEVKTFETKISPLLKQIMKVPEAYYNTFIITEKNLNTLIDFEKIDQYYTTYTENNTL